jgi:lysophospholipase L1-like esterase
MPEGATVVPATAALLATGKTPAELFFDNNHLTVEGARIVGETLAKTLGEVLR